MLQGQARALPFVLGRHAVVQEQAPVTNKLAPHDLKAGEFVGAEREDVAPAHGRARRSARGGIERLGDLPLKGLTQRRRGRRDGVAYATRFGEWPRDPVAVARALHHDAGDGPAIGAEAEEGKPAVDRPHPHHLRRAPIRARAHSRCGPACRRPVAVLSCHPYAFARTIPSAARPAGFLFARTRFPRNKGRLLESACALSYGLTG